MAEHLYLGAYAEKAKADAKGEMLKGLGYTVTGPTKYDGARITSEGWPPEDVKKIYPNAWVVTGVKKDA